MIYFININGVANLVKMILYWNPKMYCLFITNLKKILIVESKNLLSFYNEFKKILIVEYVQHI